MAKIVIIDSGVNRNHPKLEGAQIEGIHLWKDEEGNIQVDDDVTDGYGHGTAVANIISKNSNHNEIIAVKIFDGDYQTDEELLTASLQYIYNNIPCDVINLSLGVTEYDSLTELRQICEKLYRRGTILVSAFDNFGMVSFPAAFEHVIDVDTSVKAKKNKEYEIVKNSYVNVLGKGGVQRVAWSDPEFIITKGNSFVAFDYHSLRHTHATLLIENGADVKDVQTRLGHTNIETTLQTYVHDTEKMVERSVDLFEQVTQAKTS